MITYKQIIEGMNIKPKTGFFGYSSVVLIKDGKEKILFDTGGPGVRGFLFNFIKKEKINKVFLSHLHLDHCCNVDLFSDIPIYVNELELENLISNKNSIDNKVAYIILKNYIENKKFKVFDKKFKLTKNIEVIKTYGHTRGHSSLMFNCGRKKVILAGDAVETYKEYISNQIQPGCYDENDYKKTKKFIKDNFDVIIPGHSAAIIKGKKFNNEPDLIYF